MILRSGALSWATLAGAVAIDREQAASATIPDYFQTTPQIFAGPTETAQIPPFLAQTNQAPFGQSYVPNAPLETALPIANNPNHSSIFQFMGHLSTYFPNPVGFGVDEHPLPPGANISQVHLLHRHGSRYPTSGTSLTIFGSKLHNVTANGTAQWTGPLNFLQNWEYTLGAEILVARGRQELFDSGVLHYIQYGALYNTSTKIIARTTTQDRMLKSAENWMAGFFGLEWTNNATLEVIIEKPFFNNTLAGAYQCNNSYSAVARGGSNASRIWDEIYLGEATARLNKFSGSYNWTLADSYNAQTLCPYETVAYGYSKWCQLFTFPEWQGFEYSIDLLFHGNSGFGSPTGRAVGVGYVQELRARLAHHLYDLPPGSTQANTTLDTQPSTFPLNQTLYFDFSHDTNIMAVITALGLRQFAQHLSPHGQPENQQLIVSHLTPFAARLVWEIIQAPHPVRPARPKSPSAAREEYYDTSAGPTRYVHVTLNQRTIPLGKSYPECGERDDGWCEMGVYMEILERLLGEARYEFACFGDYEAAEWGVVTDGVPVEESKEDMIGPQGEDGGAIDWKEELRRKREAGAASLVYQNTFE